MNPSLQERDEGTFPREPKKLLMVMKHGSYVVHHQLQHFLDIDANLDFFAALAMGPETPSPERHERRAMEALQGFENNFYVEEGKRSGMKTGRGEVDYQGTRYRQNEI
ncbi:hypothetical protein MKZ38_002589 [Zalerion maritima]|uniref:Uncharacterized protein n=1 Tax=Zalerion maritima TaxID=339359 RepID=A0AAD5WR50_9PEZI|nr:hypothetical protein MKZ38_002589 [Zalerion maritima]